MIEVQALSSIRPQKPYADFLPAAQMKLKSFYHCSKQALQSLKVVEYLGPELLESCYNSDNARISVQVYALYHTPRSLEEHEDFPEGQITKMPHAIYEGKWDE